MMHRFLRRLVVAMLLAVALYGAFVVYTGVRAIGDSLSRFHWSMLAAALGLATFNYCLRFLKWEYYLSLLQVRGVPKLESFLVFISGFVLTVTPGKVGEVFKSAVLQETHGVPVQRTAPIVVAERLTDVIGVIVLILLGSLGFSGGLWVAVAGSVCVVLGMVLILWRAPMTAMLRWMERRPGRLAEVAPKLRESYEGLRIVASPVALLWPTFLSVLGWGCEGLALHLLLRGFGETAPMTLSMFFYATATLAGALVPVPGGLGVVETFIHQGLVLGGGVDSAAATSAMILIRFATLWWAVVCGFAALGLLRMRFPMLLRDGAAPSPPGAVR